MNQHFDFNGQVEPYSFVLSYPDHRHLGELVNITDRQVNEIFNGADEISFTVHRYADDVEEELWDLLVSLQYIYVPQMDEYFLIEVDEDDGDGETKSVSGIGAAEAELAQSLIYSLEINSELDIAREEYKSPTVFYDREHPENSLLNRTLDKLPNWSIGHVDGSIQKIQRTFSVNNKDAYSFFTEEVAKEIGCLFKFDSVKRQINAYDLKTRCLDCGHRGEFQHTCPKCGSTKLKDYGEDTTIFVDTENLSKDLNLTTDVDSIKNCFRLVAGDDDMTAAVENQNPNGSPYIYHFSAENKALMPEELVKRLEEYDELVKSYDYEYRTLAKKIYISLDKIMELTSTMMPGEKYPPTTAEKECARLTDETLSPLGYNRLTENTRMESISNAVTTWVRAHLHSAAYKITFNDISYQYEGVVDSAGSTAGSWRGSITLTNYSDKEDTYTTLPLTIKVTSDYSTYLVQRLEKLLEDYNRKEKGNIYDPLKMEDLDQFKEACTKYCLNRLKSFADAIDGCLMLMTQEGISAENPTREKAELKEKVYDPYLKKLEIVNKEIDVRQGEIDAENDLLSGYQSRHQEIQQILNFQKYLGDLYNTFLIYKREQTYDNSNYISADLDNVTIWENATAFMDVAKDELFKAATYQHQISGSVFDFLAMPEFKDLGEHFELGNWIRVRISDDIYRLRLIKIGFHFDDMETFDIEFSDVTQTRNGATDLSSVLEQAQSIAGTYGYVQNQVRKSKEQTDLMQDFVNRGFDTSIVEIVNNADNPEFKLTEQGLVVRQYNDFTQSYEPEEIRILNNGIYYTSDNWQNAKAGLGHFIYYDPETGEEKDGFGILADQVVSNVVLTKEVAVYNTDNTIRLDGQGFTFVADCTDGANKNIFDISKKYKDESGDVKTKSILNLDTDGNCVFNGASIKIQLSGGLEIVTFDEALSGENITNIINSSTGRISSNVIDFDGSEFRLSESPISWKADHSSLSEAGILIADSVDISGTMTSTKEDSAEDPVRNYVQMKDGKVIVGINTEEYGSIQANLVGDTKVMELKSGGINLIADKIYLNGNALATKEISLTDENGDPVATFKFVNGLLVE